MPSKQSYEERSAFFKISPSITNDTSLFVSVAATITIRLPIYQTLNFSLNCPFWRWNSLNFHVFKLVN